MDLVAAWTHAMSFAEGEWCVLASDDDIYEPEYLETMLGLTRKYPECELFHCRPGLIDSKGDRCEVGAGRPEFESGVSFAYSRLILRLQQTMPDFMFRRATWLQLGGFVKTKMAMHSDDATWMLMAREHGCACASEVLFWWRNSGENVSMRKDNLVEKLAATMEYKTWLRAFLSTLTPKNEPERVMLQGMLSRIDWVLAQLMRHGMNRLSTFPWIRAFFRCNVDSYTRKRFLYDRVKRLTSIL